MSKKRQSLAKPLFLTEFGETIRHAWIYLSGSLVLKCLKFISIPILTRLLTEEDYGVLNIFAAYVAIGGSVFTLNTHVGVGRYYHEKNEDFKAYLGTTMLVSMSLITLFFVVIIVFKDRLANLLDLPSFVVLFIVPGALIYILRSFHMQIFVAQRKSKTVRSFNVIVGVSSFVVAITFIYLHPIENRYMGQVWSSLVILALLAGIVYQRIGSLVQFNIRKSHIKYMFSYGMPLLPAYISGIILAQFDRVMIGSYLGNGEAGQYSFAYNIGMILITLVRPLERAWSPKYFLYMNAKKYREHDRELLKILGLTSLIACGVVLFADWLGYILGSKPFHKSLYLIPIIALSQYIMLLNPIYKRHISFAKKTIYTSIIIVLGGTLNIWLNAIFIPSYGAIAAAFTTLVSYIFILLLTLLISKYAIRLHITPPLAIMSKTLVVALACAYYYVNFYLLEFNPIIQELSKVLVFIVCAVLLFRPEVTNLLAKSVSKTNS